MRNSNSSCDSDSDNSKNEKDDASDYDDKNTIITIKTLQSDAAITPKKTKITDEMSFIVLLCILFSCIACLLLYY